MAEEKTARTGHIIAWLSLIIAVIALIVGWIAFNRTGEDLEQQVVERLDETQERIALEVKLLEARTQLALVRAGLISGKNYQEALNEVEEVENDLEKSFGTARAEVREEWQDTKVMFDNLEDELRDESANAVGTLENLLERLQRNIRTEG